MDEIRKDAFGCDETRRGDFSEPFFRLKGEERVQYAFVKVLSTVCSMFKKNMVKRMSIDLGRI